MTSPYINTELYTHVSLIPNQMDNKLYINLKQNLEQKVNKKCFNDKGYIMEIYKIIEYRDGVIEAENPSGSAIFDVRFSCRLCIPLKKSQLICKVDRVNKLLITVTNGPVIAIITNDRINDKIFYPDNNNNLRYRHDNKSSILEQGDFIKVTIISVTFNNGDDKIKAIGFIDDIATDDEKLGFYQELHNTDKDFVDFDKYIKKELEENEE
jgi:DNA-directed RNA polymerase subunit E'/Rpb7